MPIEFFSIRKELTGHSEMMKDGNEYFPYHDHIDENMASVLVTHLLHNERSRQVILKMKRDGITGDSAILRRFKACNFDALDRVQDIDDNGKINPEYVECGFKGASRHCPFSRPGDIKPYCIVKSKYHIPENYGKAITANRKRNEAGIPAGRGESNR
jgi:hypothetical protein